MSSKLILRSLKNFNIINRLATPQLFHHMKPNAINLVKPFSVSSYVKQQKNTFQDLDAFLSKEIKLEKTSQKHKSLPTVTGFNVTTDGPNVTLTKKHNDEEIIVKFNVNNTLGDDVVPEEGEEVTEPKQNEQPAAMKSKPAFNVEIKKKDKILAFWCSFLPHEYESVNAPKGEEISEDFQLDEFTIHKGEWNDNVYSADCSVLDGDLYDMMLNLLEERGIGEKFANELMNFSTAYEHSKYIELLESLHELSK